jgi:hypothetical protein
MADSVGGAGFPITGIQEGHIHFNKNDNTAYMYAGGDPANVSNWNQIVLNGGSSSRQRWHYLLTGTMMSAGFGIAGQYFFVAPLAGTITKWGIILGSTTITDNLTLRLYYDPLVSFTQIGQQILVGGTNSKVFEQAMSQSVVAGDLLMVANQNTVNPAQQTIMVGGYVDFTPN